MTIPTTAHASLNVAQAVLVALYELHLVAEDATVIPRPQEITLALAMRLLKDPDFHDEVLDWYDEHQDDPDEDIEE